MKQHTVTIKGIDFELLKRQKEHLITAINDCEHSEKQMDFEDGDKKQSEMLDGILNLLDAITDQIEVIPSPDSETQYYAPENLSTGLRQEVNSLIMEKASAIAADLVAGDIEYPFNEDEETSEEKYTDEAQELFNEFYDNEITSLYRFVNDIKLTESTFNLPERIKQIKQ